ncbi:MAG: hypothetical protein E7513_02655 [Ruminococcaceae bacterium]|nr:hypothetical protein [Oscillospiraceae bacterium]
MKKFLIVSIILILVAATAFGASLYHFVDLNKSEATVDEVAPTQAPTKATEKEVEKTKVELPESFKDNGIFSENYEKAYEYVSSMSTEQMVGQMLLSACPTDETAQTLMSKYALSGYIYTADNFFGMSESEIKSLIDSYQEKASTPMIMAVEEEGGAVTAISDLDAFPQYDFGSPRDVFAEGGLDALKESEQRKATMLSSVGINLNLAPVCDMADDFTQIMYSRSLGGTVEETGQYVKNTTEISQNSGVSVALKHFPGYGTMPDSFDEVKVDTREVTTFEQNDFKPFGAGIDADAHCVMMSNVLVQNLDPTCIASLSDYIHTVLKDRIGFTGLIITDNLNNADYSAYANENDVYVQAVLANNDLIIVDKVEEAYMAILSAVKDGKIEEEVLEKACTRIIAYKYTAGIMK